MSNERGKCQQPGTLLSRLPNGWSPNESQRLDPAHADRVADAWIKAQALLRLHTFGTVTRLSEGGELRESSVTKVFGATLTALHQKCARTAWARRRTG